MSTDIRGHYAPHHHHTKSFLLPEAHKMKSPLTKEINLKDGKQVTFVGTDQRSYLHIRAASSRKICSDGSHDHKCLPRRWIDFKLWSAEADIHDAVEIQKKPRRLRTRPKPSRFYFTDLSSRNLWGIPVCLAPSQRLTHGSDPRSTGYHHQVLFLI